MRRTHLAPVLTSIMSASTNGAPTPSEALKVANGANAPIHEGFAGLFFTAAVPGRGLPLELFLSVVRRVRAASELDLIRASQVCPAWRKIILDCPDLWDQLKNVELGTEKQHVRLCTTASRAKVSLAS